MLRRGKQQEDKVHAEIKNDTEFGFPSSLHNNCVVKRLFTG